jgi:hypothetical protein
LCREYEKTGKAAWRGQPAIGTCRATSRSDLDEVRNDMSKNGIGSSEKLKGLLLTCFFMYCLVTLQKNQKCLR